MKIPELKHLLQRIAAIESVISPEWDMRYFSFNAKWAPGEEMGSMRSGSGDEWFVWFSGELCAYKSFSHEEKSITDVDGVKKSTPLEYARFMDEPAFSLQYSTQIGYLCNGKWVSVGCDPLCMLTPQQVSKWTAADYHNWAREYYEREIDEELLGCCWNDPVNYALASRLNPELIEEEFRENLIEIGLS